MNVVLILLTVYLAIAGVLAAWLSRAPLGYEDSGGFHAGNPPRPRSEPYRLEAKY